MIHHPKRAKLGLGESNSGSRAVIEHSTDAVGLIDETGTLLYASPSTQEVLGYAPEEYVGGTPLDHVHPADRQHLRALLGGLALQPGAVVSSQYRARHKDGSWHWVEGTATNLLAEPRVGAIVLSYRDITERKRTEALQQQFAAIVDGSNDAIIGQSLDGTITSWNAAAQRLYGYSAEEVKGRPLAIIIPPDCAGELDQILEQIKRGERVEQLETLRLRKDGTVVPVSVTISPIMDTEGAVVGASSIARDISEQRRMEEELRRHAAQVEAVNKELEAFNVSVSHDLRLPLMGIGGYTDLLLELYGDRLDDTGRKYLHTIRAVADRMARSIDDLLQFARATHSEPQPEEVDLSALVQAIIAEIELTEPTRRVEFVVAPNLSAHGDPRLLRVALENLLGNAWKFTRKHSPARIEFGATEDAGEVVYFVRDNGAGFDMARADKLFTAFHRLHSEPEYSGTGVGLATVRRIIERHGGRIWADAAVGRGATFSFTLGDNWEHERKNSPAASRTSTPWYTVATPARRTA
jgi:PAS domain S-box-containing protein